MLFAVPSGLRWAIAQVSANADPVAAAAPLESPFSHDTLTVVYAEKESGSAAVVEEGHQSIGNNRPVQRRALILQSLFGDRKTAPSAKPTHVPTAVTVTSPAADLTAASAAGGCDVHSERYLKFLSTAHDDLLSLGEDADPGIVETDGSSDATNSQAMPDHIALRCPNGSVDPGTTLAGQLSFYAQDRYTPITKHTATSLRWDLAVALKSADLVGDGDCNNVYCLTTHPGHHAGAESYGGYCFVNMCAVVVRRLQTKTQLSKIAVIDVDYHAGNGTASIFYTDPTVLVCSLHLDPDLEYPYNSGFEHQKGAGKGEGTTLHVPFPAATGWKDYSVGLAKVVEKVKAFGADAVVVSLGLDTLKGDPECVPLGGMNLEPKDYIIMGEMLRSCQVPVVYVAEGGYKLDTVPIAARCVVLGEGI